MSREAILGRIRTALGRSAGQQPGVPPEPLLLFTASNADQRMQHFLTALHALNVKTFIATSLVEARGYVEDVTLNKRAICSAAAVLQACGIDELPSVDNTTPPSCADVGITGVDFALSNTGTLVMLASAENPRMFSLLPPIHIAVVIESQLIDNLDELYRNISMPADRTSSMVLITGPSRTADIEQILVRGVHGPGELHVVFLRN